MKKIIVILLALALLLSLCSCGKTPAIADLMDYPLGAGSLDECEKFVKSCGYKVESKSEQGIMFTDGTWSGYASLGSVSLDFYSFQNADADFDATADAVRAELKSLCGEPCAGDFNNMFNQTSEWYTTGDKVIYFSIYHGMENMSVTIMPAPKD